MGGGGFLYIAFVGRVITSNMCVVGLQAEHERVKSLSYIEESQQLTSKTENSRSSNICLLFRNMEVKTVASQKSKMLVCRNAGVSCFSLQACRNHVYILLQ